MRDRTEAVALIGVEHPVGPPVDLDPDGLTGHVSRALGTKPKADRKKVGLEDRFEDDLGGRHDTAVAHRRDRQGSGRIARRFHALPAVSSPDPRVSSSAGTAVHRRKCTATPIAD
jgi:hypothetical protein